MVNATPKCTRNTLEQLVIMFWLKYIKKKHSTSQVCAVKLLCRQLRKQKSFVKCEVYNHCLHQLHSIQYVHTIKTVSSEILHHQPHLEPVQAGCRTRRLGTCQLNGSSTALVTEGLISRTFRALFTIPGI